MSNTRRNAAFGDLQGEARILAIGRQICSLLSDGHEHDRISVLMGLAGTTCSRYASLWRRHQRQTQPRRRYGLGGTAGLKD